MFNGNSEGHKQYLLLSPFAQDIVEYDAYIFMEKPSRDGFINEIITKYMDKADASISIRLEEKRNQLLSLGNSRDESFIDIVEMLVNQYRDDLISKMDYGNGKRFPSVGINKENSARIYNNPDCSESDYYGDKPGVYIRAIIEEYTRLPFSERERVMLSTKINDIQAAINTKTMLKITLKNQKTYYVRPHSISLDEQHRYHYLVGMARAYESKALEQQGFISQGKRKL